MTDNKTIEKLQKLGFSEKEAQIYLASLSLGPANLAVLAKKADLKRSTTHYIVEAMQAKGLLEKTIIGKRGFYQAATPRKIKSLISKQEIVLESLLPDLEKQYRQQYKKPTVSFHENKQGICEVDKKLF